MGLFSKKPKHETCKTCRVHFEPYFYYEELYREYCPTHREPLVAAYRRKEAFMHWASANWERLDKIRVKEEKKRASKIKSNPSAPYMVVSGSQLAAQQLAAQAQANAYGQQHQGSLGSASHWRVIYGV